MNFVFLNDQWPWIEIGIQLDADSYHVSDNCFQHILTEKTCSIFRILIYTKCFQIATDPCHHQCTHIVFIHQLAPTEIEIKISIKSLTVIYGFLLRFQIYFEMLMIPEDTNAYLNGIPRNGRSFLFPLYLSLNVCKTLLSCWSRAIFIGEIFFGSLYLTLTATLTLSGNCFATDRKWKMKLKIWNESRFW